MEVGYFGVCLVRVVVWVFFVVYVCGGWGMWERDDDELVGEV